MDAYEEYMSILMLWHRTTGAPCDVITGLVMQAAVENDLNPLIVARVAHSLYPLVKENFKQPAMEAPKK